MAKGLKGFANLGAFPTVADTASAYSATGTKLVFVGASSCSVNDNREDFSIPGDDGIYDEGSEWKSTELAPVVHEVDLETLAALAGCDINTAKTAIEEGTYDIPNVVALVFTALRRDGGYRCYRYYCSSSRATVSTTQLRAQATTVSPTRLHSLAHRENMTVKSAALKTSMTLLTRRPGLQQFRQRLRREIKIYSIMYGALIAP